MHVASAYAMPEVSFRFTKLDRQKQVLEVSLNAQVYSLLMLWLLQPDVTELNVWGDFERDCCCSSIMQ